MADFMHRFLPESRIWIPKPTWANHHKCAHASTAAFIGWLCHCYAQRVHQASLDGQGMGDMQGTEHLTTANANHLNNALAVCSIWRDAQVQQELYRYYEPETKGLDQEGLLEDLSKGKAGDVVLLHACAHNPTGQALSHPHICRYWPAFASHLTDDRTIRPRCPSQPAGCGVCPLPTRVRMAAPVTA